MKAYRTAYHTRKYARLRRDQLDASGRCINGAAHGPATHGCRCIDCYWVHAFGKNPHRPSMLQVELRRIALA